MQSTLHNTVITAYDIMIEQTPIVKVRVNGINLPVKNEFANLFIRKNLTLYQI